ncbi:MAG TPA: FkbM family methyltransferase [Lacibacter sp.]|nr:FkbM family methyltransferase [Lacibacter sp.]HMO90478.1 FkbM family methyltransferase [Lacibacter sp.]HMP87895.1 FkbM family methyltransferase [Lacibacter sp.]
MHLFRQAYGFLPHRMVRIPWPFARFPRWNARLQSMRSLVPPVVKRWYYRLAFRLPLPLQRLLLEADNVDTVCFMRRYLRAGCTGVDVGAHAGVLLEQLLRVAPAGRHHAVEPLPVQYSDLQRRLGKRLHVHQLALAATTGPATFFSYPRRPAVSGLLRRDDWGGSAPVCLPVITGTLDQLIPPGSPVNFIKIDAEGSELGVLQGARRILRECRPFVAFEMTVGKELTVEQRASALFDLLLESGYQLAPIGRAVAGASALDKDGFLHCIRRGNPYFFLAAPDRFYQQQQHHQPYTNQQNETN